MISRRLSVVVLLAASAGPVGFAQADSYVLPFPKRPARRVLQGYSGPYGHQRMAEFADDSQMPIGSPVLDARAGDVVHLVEGNQDATRNWATRTSS